MQILPPKLVEKKRPAQGWNPRQEGGSEFLPWAASIKFGPKSDLSAYRRNFSG